MGATKGRGIYLRKSLRAILFGQLPDTSTPRISPGSHSTVTSNGRQHTSQSVVKRWLGTLVSIKLPPAKSKPAQAKRNGLFPLAHSLVIRHFGLVIHIRIIHAP
jgi:hypothetical protein